MFSYKLNLNRFEIFWLRAIMAISNITGVAPFRMAIIKSNNRNNKQKEFIIKFSYSLKGSIYSFLLSFILFHTIYSLLYSRKAKYVGFSYIEQIIRVTLTISQTLGVINMSQRYCFQQRTILDIIDKLLYVENEIRKKFINIYSPRIKSFSHIFIFFFFLFINITMAGVEIYQKGSFHQNIIIHSIPYFIMSSAMIQYTLVVIFLQRKFQNLNKLLLSLTNFQLKNQDEFISMTKPLQDKMVLEDVLFVQQTHRDLYKVTNIASNYFAPIILLPILQCCLGTTYNVFNLISKIKLLYKHDELISWVIAVLWLIRYLYPVVILSCFVNTMISEMKKTGDIIYRVSDKNLTNVGVQDQLRQFSMELLHRNPRVTVYGLFSLSSSFITSITGMIMTYMIILIQVKESFLER